MSYVPPFGRAERLRLSRIAAGLKLHEAAELLMMHPRLLSDMEHERAECSFEQFQLILDVYRPYEERG